MPPTRLPSRRVPTLTSLLCLRICSQLPMDTMCRYLEELLEDLPAATRRRAVKTFLEWFVTVNFGETANRRRRGRQPLLEEIEDDVMAELQEDAPDDDRLEVFLRDYTGRPTRRRRGRQPLMEEIEDDVMAELLEDTSDDDRLEVFLRDYTERPTRRRRGRQRLPEETIDEVMAVLPVYIPEANRREVRNFLRNYRGSNSTRPTRRRRRRQGDDDANVFGKHNPDNSPPI